MAGTTPYGLTNPFQGPQQQMPQLPGAQAGQGDPNAGLGASSSLITGDRNNRTISVGTQRQDPFGRTANVQTKLNQTWDPQTGTWKTATSQQDQVPTSPYGEGFGASGSMAPGSRMLTGQGQQLLQQVLSGLQQQPQVGQAPQVSAGAPVSLSTGPTAAAEQAANAAAFGQAKDAAANTARASLNALQGELTRRGLTGGGYEAGQIGNTLANESNQLGRVIAGQAQNQYERAAQIANEEYQGELNQREQNIGVNEANAARAQQQQQMQLQAGMARQQQLMQALQGLGGMGFLTY